MEMVQVAWAAIGLLAVTVIGVFIAMFQLAFQQNAKIDTGFRELAGRIDALGSRLDARIDALSGQLQAHIERHAG